MLIKRMPWEGALILFERALDEIVGECRAGETRSPRRPDAARNAGAVAPALCR